MAVTTQQLKLAIQKSVVVSSNKLTKAAASNAIRHLFLPLMASTLTTVLSFLPILLLPGNAGDFVGSISGSVIVALIGSFFISMTIIAALAGLLGKGGTSNRNGRTPRWMREGVQSPGLVRVAQHWLLAAYRRPLAAVGLSLVVPIIGFGLAQTLGSQFFPRTDRNMFEVEVRLPTDATIERTRAVLNPLIHK